MSSSCSHVTSGGNTGEQANEKEEEKAFRTVQKEVEKAFKKRRRKGVQKKEEEKAFSCPNLRITKLDAGLVEGVSGMGSAEAHAHVHVVTAGGKSSIEHWEGVEMLN